MSPGWTSSGTRSKRKTNSGFAMMAWSAVADPGLETAVFVAELVHHHEGLEIFDRRGSAEGPRREVGQDLIGAGALLVRALRVAREDLLTARRVGDLRSARTGR